LRGGKFVRLFDLKDPEKAKKLVQSISPEGLGL
jgi:hypothetical protein